MKKGSWHPVRDVHNVLNMRHKGRWHAFGSEHAFSGVSNAKCGDKIGMRASPVPSRGPKRGHNCYVTPTLSGVPNAKHGDKIRSGYFSIAFSGAQKRAELLRNPCLLGGSPIRRGQNQNWLPHPCLLGGPKKGGIAT